MKKMIFSCSAALFTMMAPLCAGYDACCVEQENFQGFYVGGNLGVISHTAHRNDLDGFLTDNSGWSRVATGFAGGGQIGYDWKCDNRVFGLVFDFNGATPKHTLLDNPNVVDPDNFIKTSLDWFGTLRARTGVEVCNSLIYLSAGFAFAHLDTKWNDDPNLFHNSNTRWGWAGSIGTEYLYCKNVSFGLELYTMQFADNVKTYEDSDNPGTFFAFGHSDSTWGARLMVNYRFGNICR